MGATYRKKSGSFALNVDAAQFLADYERGDVEPGASLDYNGFKTTAGDYYRRLKAATAPPMTPPPAGVPVPPPANFTPEEIERRALEEAQRVMKQKYGDEFEGAETPSSICGACVRYAVIAIVASVAAIYFFDLSGKKGYDGYSVGKYGWQPNTFWSCAMAVAGFFALGYWVNVVGKFKQYKDIKRIIKETRESLNNGGTTHQRNQNSG